MKKEEWIENAALIAMQGLVSGIHSSSQSVLGWAQSAESQQMSGDDFIAVRSVEIAKAMYKILKVNEK
jgi:hypothetical protein